MTTDYSKRACPVEYPEDGGPNMDVHWVCVGPQPGETLCPCDLKIVAANRLSVATILSELKDKETFDKLLKVTM